MSEANDESTLSDLLGLAERLRQRGNDLRSHPLLNSTIDRVEEVGELLHEASEEIRRLRAAYENACAQRAAERERCAMICQDYAADLQLRGIRGFAIADRCSERIRGE